MSLRSVRPAIPGLLTIILLASQLAATPALTDPVAGNLPPSLHLSIPRLYLVLGPLFTVWDGISMLSMSRLQGLPIGLAGLYLLWRIARLTAGGARRRWGIFWLRELGVLILSIAILLCFLVVGATWHRPMLSLSGVSPDDRVVDFHSHTAFSHDVGNTWMRGFDANANRRWHGRAGFDATFVTDHNTIEGARDGEGHPVLCPGIEVSAWRAHIVLLGDTLSVNRDRYSRSLEGLLELLRTSETAFRSLTVASLPEYRRNHWNRLDTLITAGLDGFEIVNASPKGNELTLGERSRVIGLARLHDRFVVGVSDSHGWGATSMVWNLVRVDTAAPAAGICGLISDQLRRGFPAVRVVERHRLRPDDRWPMWLTPIGMLWETWRSMGLVLTVSWLVWIWLFYAGSRLLRRSALRVKIARMQSSGSSPRDQ